MVRRCSGARAVLVAGVALLAGCGAEDGGATSEPVGRVASAIQGGAPDSSHAYAVGVCIGRQSSQCEAICSGALIAPNLVVTARHCVDTMNSAKVDCATTTFGSQTHPASSFWITTSQSVFQANQGWHQVASIATPADSGACGNDLALLILADAVSRAEATPATPAVQYAITDRTRYKPTETAIGYGLTTPTDQSSAGQRHILTNIDIGCIPGDKELDCPALAGVDVKEFQSGDGTCEGDSGSSAFEQTSFDSGNPVSLGVLSRGTVSQDGSTCLSAIYTRLDAWKDFIVATAHTAATQGGYPAPDWACVGDACAPPAPSKSSGCEARAPVHGGAGAAGAWVVGLIGLALLRRRSR